MIVEQLKDAQKFRDGYNFDRKKQAAIASKFLVIIKRAEAHRYDVDGLFVTFSTFAPIAKEEADNQVSEEQIEALKRSIGNTDLWGISRCFGHVTFMFYTDEQARVYEAEGKREIYARMYFEVLKAYDEFGYLVEKDFTINFDSKQNFDDNYQGNWYYYYK